MGEQQEAVLTNGKKIPFVVVAHPPHGGMKHTYFAPDQSYVVQFYNDPEQAQNPHLLKRLEAIVGPYNPTLSQSKGGAVGTDEAMARYFSTLFCWPIGIVKEPQVGIVCPTYGKNFFFEATSSYEYNLSGQDKRSTWFTTTRRKYLAKAELGNFKAMLQLSLLLARSVRRLHQAGLAHSDLSNNNVLIDPKTGTCAIIDIDSLVVPGVFPPQVIGTPGYIAPEVLTAARISKGTPERPTPGAGSDLHALAVLLYEYLLCRHPLVGPKIYCEEDGDEDDFLTFGPAATFIEHPADLTNRPEHLRVTIQDLGADLEALFLRAFVDGLHQPDLRPTAMEWEQGLERAWELLYPCNYLPCDQKWFVLQDFNKAQCPFCGQKPKHQELLRLKFKTAIHGKPGHWQDIRQTNCPPNSQLYPWHLFPQIHPNEKTQPIVKAEVRKTGGQWSIFNKTIPGLISPQGVLVPIGSSFTLRDGDLFRMTGEEKGFLAEVIIKPL